MWMGRIRRPVHLFRMHHPSCLPSAHPNSGRMCLSLHETSNISVRIIPTPILQVWRLPPHSSFPGQTPHLLTPPSVSQSPCLPQHLPFTPYLPTSPTTFSPTSPRATSPSPPASHVPGAASPSTTIYGAASSVHPQVSPAATTSVTPPGAPPAQSTHSPPHSPTPPTLYSSSRGNISSSPAFRPRLMQRKTSSRQTTLRSCSLLRSQSMTRRACARVTATPRR